MVEETLFMKEQAVCYSILFLLTFIGIFTDAVPIQVSITLHSMLIIALGSFKSLEEMLKQIKKVHIDKTGASSSIEKMSFDDAWQFPVVAGITLCGLYFGMEYFGKDTMNYFLMVYIAMGGTQGIKALLEAFFGGAFKAYDKDLLIDINVKLIGLELQVTLFDLFCFFLSGIQMGLYIWSKNWVYNNVLCLIFCTHALQSMFIGNFKNGFMLLTLLFFYDIFFVFGTDVMLTVAKGIDAPIKLMFPKDYTKEGKAAFSILGLGDIVIPGIFVSLCLRFDFLKNINPEYLDSLIKADEKGTAKEDPMGYLVKKAVQCDKTYFFAVNIGYFLAMVCTIVVMLVFSHGQPALLYLVPGVCLAVLGTACMRGEYQKLMEHDEELYITSPDEDEDDDGKKKN
jgi:minor histocompatibility antigen H13